MSLDGNKRRYDADYEPDQLSLVLYIYILCMVAFAGMKILVLCGVVLMVWI